MGWRGPRRAFLNGLGKATAVGWSTSTLGLSAWASGKDVGQLGKDRSQESFRIREECADKERHVGTPPQIPNEDENRYRSFTGNYSKGLPHNSVGEVDPSSYQVFLEALRKGTTTAFEDVPLGGSAKLVNPLAGMAFDLEGADSHQLACAPAPSVSSQVSADEMIELYWMALCRDVNFSEFASSPTALAAAAELSSLGGFRGPKSRNSVTPQTLFRGYTREDSIGPYVSQLFQIPFNYGQFFLSGQVNTSQPETDYLTTQAKWLECQNG